MKDSVTNKLWGSYIGPSDIKRDLGLRSVHTVIKWMKDGLLGPVTILPCGKPNTTTRRVLTSEYIKFKQKRTS